MPADWQSEIGGIPGCAVVLHALRVARSAMEN